MFADFLNGYRQYATPDLLAEQAALRSQRTIYIQQSMGSKSMQRNLNMLEERLRAVDYVLRERGPLTPVKPPINNGIGIADFGGIA